MTDYNSATAFSVPHLFEPFYVQPYGATYMECMGIPVEVSYVTDTHEVGDVWFLIRTDRDPTHLYSVKAAPGLQALLILTSRV